MVYTKSKLAKVTLNDEGWELWNKWAKIYVEENDRLGGNSAEGDYVDGLCILEPLAKTVEDVCRVLIYGEDCSVLYCISDCIYYEPEGINAEWYSGCGFTIKDVLDETRKYLKVIEPSKVKIIKNIFSSYFFYYVYISFCFQRLV